MLRFPVLNASVAFALWLAAAPFCAQQSATEVPAYRADPKFTAAYKEGEDLEHQRRFTFAEDAYKKANKIAGGRCEECLIKLLNLQLSTGSYKAAEKSAVALEALQTTDVGKAIAEFRRALAMFEDAGEKPKEAQLEAIHGVLQESLGHVHKNAAALFLDGKVLARLGKLEDAKAAFTQAASTANAKDPSHLRALHFAEDPELSLHKMAPAFEVTALDGTSFNLDAMGGRVVLIDFWATWCGPCNEELPHMRQIAQDFAGQPLVILSVSWDKDETKWKDFIAKNGMSWLQYRDADHKLSDQFGIDAIPHYFTIDSDGVLTAEMLGSGSDVEGKLKKLVARARESQRQLASAGATPGQVSIHAN